MRKKRNKLRLIWFHYWVLTSVWASVSVLILFVFGSSLIDGLLYSTFSSWYPVNQWRVGFPKTANSWIVGNQLGWTMSSSSPPRPLPPSSSSPSSFPSPAHIATVSNESCLQQVSEITPTVSLLQSSRHSTTQTFRDPSAISNNNNNNNNSNNNNANNNNNNTTTNSNNNLSTNILNIPFTSATGLVYTFTENSTVSIQRFLSAVTPQDKDGKSGTQIQQQGPRLLVAAANVNHGQALSGPQFQKFSFAQALPTAGAVANKPTAAVKVDQGEITHNQEEKSMSLSTLPVTFTTSQPAQPQANTVTVVAPTTGVVPASVTVGTGTATVSNTSQPIQFQTDVTAPGSTSEAILSAAINYNDGEILPDGTFDISVRNNLPTLEEGILGNYSMSACLFFFFSLSVW